MSSQKSRSWDHLTVFAVRVCRLGLDLLDQEVHLLSLVLLCVSAEPGVVVLSPSGALLLLIANFWLLPFLHGWRKSLSGGSHIWLHPSLGR